MIVPDTLRHSTSLKDALFAVLSQAPYGEIFSYAALTEIMGVDARAHRYALAMVGQRLEHEAQRVLESLRGVGYRIALARDHVDLGARKQVQGRRKIERALSILHATPVKTLTPVERQRHDAFLLLLHQQADVLRSVRQAHMEVSTLIEKHIADALARLAALEDTQER